MVAPNPQRRPHPLHGQDRQRGDGLVAVPGSTRFPRNHHIQMPSEEDQLPCGHRPPTPCRCQRPRDQGTRSGERLGSNPQPDEAISDRGDQPPLVVDLPVRPHPICYGGEPPPSGRLHRMCSRGPRGTRTTEAHPGTAGLGHAQAKWDSQNQGGEEPSADAESPAWA